MSQFGNYNDYLNMKQKQTFTDFNNSLAKKRDRFELLRGKSKDASWLFLDKELDGINRIKVIYTDMKKKYFKVTYWYLFRAGLHENLFTDGLIIVIPKYTFLHWLKNIFK